MSQELSVFDHNGTEVVDSREVAAMVEVRHADLLEKISGYSKHLANGKFRSLDFFIPCTYKDAQDKERPCYLLTKKGCDMVANKMTGEKGVLFTAAYVTAFENMRARLQSGTLGLDTAKAVLAEAKLNNSRARISSMWMKIAEKVSIPEYQQICAHYASSALAGKEVLPLPETASRTYTAEEAGKLFGISANKIGRIANQYKLKTPEYGVEVWDKSKYSSKQVPTWRYNEKGLERLRQLLQ